VRPTLGRRQEAGHDLPVLVWRLAGPVWAIASGPLGGGIGERHWVINATVHRDYRRQDPDAHLADLATDLGLIGPGSGLLTAVDVTDAVHRQDGGVTVAATVGLGYPTWAAAADLTAPAVGTVNIVAFVPVRLSDAALVNAVATVTEAKAQALLECGVEGTGTASDAVFIGCQGRPGEPVEPFGGPRSTWGARLARAVHAAVEQGTRRWLERSSR
jgi:adenosylcobinamide amidohydrolase